MDFKSLPKIELHCHLDGGMDMDLVAEYLESKGEKVSREELTNRLQVQPDCTSLAEYLMRFDLPCQVLQTKENLRRQAYCLAKADALEGVTYLETRFAPNFHKNEGLNLDEILDAVALGLSDAKKEFGIESGILVCAMRHMSLEDNLAVLKAAREHLGSGVVGFDIAGDEASFPMEMFEDLFHEAKRLEIPFTIHAGECGRAQNVRGAIELGTARVGHGIAMDGHADLVKLCADKHVGVELCPTSNLQTHALESLNDYPIRRYLEAGIPVSVNTDNRTVSGISLSHEYEVLDDIFHFTDEDLRRIYTDSVDVAFATDDVKHALLKRL